MKLSQLIFGKPRDPLSKETRKQIALIAFMAWVGLGADGLSSSCYGPEQAFYALGGHHHHLALYLVIATALTVFLIASAYKQVIRLFPNGGGGYKVASVLLGPSAGLVSGAALLVDYMLTIAISVASGTDAIFSLLPSSWLHFKLIVEVLFVFILLLLNLRGAKESIKILLPIFVGFFLTHILMILSGILMHEQQIPSMIHATILETQSASTELGWFVLLGIFLKAYSLGAGTYTGLEAVSNNVQILAEPRSRTGSWTMLYMAISLSLVAGGVILLYLLWDARPVYGQTLNAVVFSHILGNMPFHTAALIILMLFEAGLLFVAANTGFLGGPAVLANMSVDLWAPKRFSMLSNRLVTQNGILFFGLAALFLLLGTNGHVSILVVLYSMNVFLTFSMSLLGLTIYWWRHRHIQKHWCSYIVLSSLALVICVGILLTTLLEKFDLGGWITVVITSVVIVIGFIIRRHYNRMKALKEKLNHELSTFLGDGKVSEPVLDPKKPTAVFLVKELGGAMHSLLWVHSMFPHYFKNFVFISHGEVDIGNFGSDEALRNLKKHTMHTLSYLVKYSKMNGIAAESYASFGIDPVEHVYGMAENLSEKYSRAIYFSTRYIYPTENIFTHMLHGDLAGTIERRLNKIGVKMLILPLALKI